VPLNIGSTASFSKKITEQDVVTFAQLSGDNNPMHLDENYAKGTRFGARIAHGAFSFAVISTVLGTRLPGPGTIYMSQTLKFLKPVYFDDTITGTAEITAIRADKGIVTLKTACTNQRGEPVAEGEAVVFHPDAKSAV
jgi:3-hydroxybutyryl-CoA dehydratase